jgi:hypothetical protein
MPAEFNIYNSKPTATTATLNSNNLQIMSSNGLSNSTNLLVGSYHSVSDISVLSDAENDEPSSIPDKRFGNNYQHQYHSVENASSRPSLAKCKSLTSQSDEFEFMKPRDTNSPMSLSFEKLDLKQVSFLLPQ